MIDYDDDIGAAKATRTASEVVKLLPQQQQKYYKMTQAGNPDTHTHNQLDIQKIPEDIMDVNNAHNSMATPPSSLPATAIPAITLTPTSLNTTTTTTTTTPTRKTSKDCNVSSNGNSIDGDDNNGQYHHHHNDHHHNHHHHHHHHHDYKGPKFWLYLVHHWPSISQPLAILAIVLAIWTIAYALLPQYATPETAIMRMVFLFVGAQVTGMLVEFINLPDMLGMLFFGVLYTNIGLADFSGYQPLEACLREMALINIMLLAGLGLDANAFKKLWLMILRLTLIPTIAEVAIIAILGRYILSMPWLWGVLLGVVITAVSPNVVVTVMLKLKEERLGLNNGIHTLIYAMTSCNDVVAIFVFGIILGLIFSTDSLTQQILQGPVGIGIGIVYGFVYGYMLQVLPSKEAYYVNGLRFVLTILGGTIAVMGSKAIGYPSAGALGCMTVAFFAGIGWKKQQQKQHKQQQQKQQQQEQQQQQCKSQYANENNSVAKRLDLLWKFLKPISFSLIGKEIQFALLDGKVVGYGALLVLLGSLFRLAFAYVSTFGGNLNRKERAYITISGFPKATVQAALGPVALDLARSLNADPVNISLASTVLIISVLAIIFTAPLGAILMLHLAPRWLEREPLDEITSVVVDVANNVNVNHHRMRTEGVDGDVVVDVFGNVGTQRSAKREQ